MPHRTMGQIRKTKQSREQNAEKGTKRRNTKRKHRPKEKNRIKYDGEYRTRKETNTLKTENGKGRREKEKEEKGGKRGER